MTNSKTSTAQAVLDAFKKENVEYVFGLTGSHVLPITDALVDVPDIRHIVSKHESNAAYMAGMYGYLTGRPGVVLVTAGPGATNSISGVAQAYTASFPMVHISGDVPLNAGNEAFHGVDRADFLHRMFADITKWSVRIERPADIPGVLSRAFALAVHGRPGPVHVDIPVDIVRATDLDIPTYQPSPVEKQNPSEALIEKVRHALKAAERPLICVGRGVMTYTAEAELRTLAEAIAAPVVCTEYAQGAIDQDHPLFTGSISEWSPNVFVQGLLAEADFVLAVGMRSNTLLTDILVEHGPKNTILVALDEPNTLQPVSGLAVTESGDTKLFLSRIVDFVEDFQGSTDPSRRAHVVQFRKAYKKGLALHLVEVAEAKPLHFGRVCLELSGRINKDAIVTAGVGHHNIWARELLPIRGRESFVQECSWGAMGGELGAGISAKLVYPDRQVVVVTGDGSLLMTASDIVTAVETGANILVVVLNDSRYGIISSMQQESYDRSFGDKIGAINFALIAEGYGATGIRVETPEALPEAVIRALELSTRSPVILDVVCDYRYRWPDRPALLAAGMKALGVSEK
jgi:acetolactate synthase I/II/III large subunit